MKVYVSTIDERKRYHRPECPFAEEIKYPYRRKLTPLVAREEGYCRCGYCGGLKGYLRTNELQFSAWSKEYGLDMNLDKRTNTLYIRTKMGFWKVFEQKGTDMYVLYHLNEFKSDMSDFDAKNGRYHRQGDIPATFSLGKIVKYVADHDKAAEIMAVDYRNLPRTTVKEKKYYKKAEERSKHYSHHRIERLFDLIEMQNPEIRNVQSVLLD